MAYSNITITTDVDLSFIAGQYVQVIHDVNNYIYGKIISYDPATGSMTITPVSFVGSGSYNDWTVVLAGISGTAGTSGNSGTSASAGTSSTAGTSGSNGTSGTSATSGSSGTSSTSGTTGTTGTSGTTGTTGTSGTNGSSGTSGTSASSGTSGSTGTSGTTGTTGTSGTSASSGTSATTGTSGSSGVSGISGGQVYYFNLSNNTDTAIGSPTYKEWSPIPTSVAQQEATITVASGVTSMLGAFATDSGVPGVDNIPAGLWSFFLHGTSNKSNGTALLWVQVYKRDLAGTETFLFQTGNAIILDTGFPQQAYTDAFWAGGDIDPTDRLIAKFYIENTYNQSQDFTFSTEGNTYYSYSTTTFQAPSGTSGTSGTCGTSGRDATSGTAATSGESAVYSGTSTTSQTLPPA